MPRLRGTLALGQNAPSTGSGSESVCRHRPRNERNRPVVRSRPRTEPLPEAETRDGKVFPARPILRAQAQRIARSCRIPRNCSRQKLQQADEWEIGERIRASWQWSKIRAMTTKSCFFPGRVLWPAMQASISILAQPTFSPRGHAGARKDDMEVAFGSRESSQFEEMAGRAAGHPQGERNRNAGRGRSTLAKRNQ